MFVSTNILAPTEPMRVVSRHPPLPFRHALKNSRSSAPPNHRPTPRTQKVRPGTRRRTQDHRPHRLHPIRIRPPQKTAPPTVGPRSDIEHLKQIPLGYPLIKPMQLSDPGAVATGFLGCAPPLCGNGYAFP